MADIRLIATVGKRGQIGLDGGLPWGDAFPEDRKRFAELTTGGILIAGARTGARLVHIDGTFGRTLLIDAGTLRDSPGLGEAPDAIAARLCGHGPRTIWIIGGAATYRRWLPYVTECVIRRLDYDGPADTWMPPLWGER